MKFEPVDNWSRDVFSEKSLREIYLKSRHIVGNNRDRSIVFWIWATLSLGIIVAQVGFNSISDPELSISLARSWASLGASYASSILGFLIAGFAIFATGASAANLQALAKVKRVERPFSEFKFVYFNFLYAFTHFGIFLALCLFTYIGLDKGSPIWATAETIHKCAPGLVNIGAAQVCVLVATYSFATLLILKSFIWNLYQGLLLSVTLAKPPAE